MQGIIDEVLAASMAAAGNKTPEHPKQLGRMATACAQRVLAYIRQELEDSGLP